MREEGFLGIPVILTKGCLKRKPTGIGEKCRPCPGRIGKRSGTVKGEGIGIGPFPGFPKEDDEVLFLFRKGQSRFVWGYIVVVDKFRRFRGIMEVVTDS